MYEGYDRQPITVPVGERLGRIFKVIGEPIDEIGPVEAYRASIHRPAPELWIKTSTEMLKQY